MKLLRWFLARFRSPGREFIVNHQARVLRNQEQQDQQAARQLEPDRKLAHA
jgi:hypothetical protein